MATLSRELRSQLERTVLEAREKAEAGARKALEQLAIHHHEPWGTMSQQERALRNRLRARGRQLGDQPDERRGGQTIARLTAECAYEQWHRMLFARFLAECGVLVEPTSGVSISLAECKELAREQGTDWLPLACSFAQLMLPQIFRSDDPVLGVSLPIEYRQGLEELLASLPTEVFLADDSLGWVYQFWQSKRKDDINASGVKIGADELPAVTQLFTEDYMVLFLLENTLGAWWASKYLGQHPELAQLAADENELRTACALPGYTWSYLRFVKDDDGRWIPAAGAFDGWPRQAREIRVLDPCMGSGHFLVFALSILFSMRMTEERTSEQEAILGVLRDNLFGLEIDPRCSQIAAFNLALAAWRRVGFRPLPPLNLACSGLAPNAPEEEWLALAGDSDASRAGMRALYRLFEHAPTIGSLIDPTSVGGDLYRADFDALRPLLEAALRLKSSNDTTRELAVSAHGIATAATILATSYTLVATNVPYLGRPKQDNLLASYCDQSHRRARADLATCLLERCVAFCVQKGSVALVTPQAWLSQPRYSHLRDHLLRHSTWNACGRLGEHAFESLQAAGAFVALVFLSRVPPRTGARFSAVDCADEPSPIAKAHSLRRNAFLSLPQDDQLRNPDARIEFGRLAASQRLEEYAKSIQGLATGDDPQFVIFFWEVASIGSGWCELLGTVDDSVPFGGRERLFYWEDGQGRYYSHTLALKEEGRLGGWRSGTEARGKRGVLVSQMRDLPVTLYLGEFYDHNACVILPRNPDDLAAIWTFCQSRDFNDGVRAFDRSLKPSNATLAKVRFDRSRWVRLSDQMYPAGLPSPSSCSPSQWLFAGHPRGADDTLAVGVLRICGYRWPRQTGSSFPDCPALGEDGLEQYAADDGIVCISALHGEATAADRLTRLLADAFSEEWSSARLNELLAAVRYGGQSLDVWLRDGFFEQHCALFHQRPFVWQLWDGLRDGFAALVNYHRLAGPNGEGRRTLEKLIYTYLGDWVDRQRADQAAGVPGADARLAAAQHLKREMEKILEGEPPYDIFVRWKPLHQQAVGWEPDLNDGVRINIRPFMTARPLGARGRNACILRMTPKIRWEKDRGKEPARLIGDFPWFWSWDEKTEDFAGGRMFDGNRWNDLHYTRAFKQAARKRKGLV